MNQKLDLESNLLPQELATQSPASSRAIRLLFPVLVIGLGVVVAWFLMTSSSHMERVAKPREARLVETITATSGSQPVVLTAWGEVAPAQQISLKSQVSGVVEELLHPLEPGSFVKAGQPLLQLEKYDYEAIRTQRQAELDQARAELDIERGNQSVALSEFTLLGEDASAADKRLMLREPQLQSAMAKVKAAEAALRSADLNLQRTLIRAPFDGVIRERLANLGSHVAVNGEVLAFTGTESAWVNVSVPVNQLRWIRYPDENGEGGSSVTLHYERVWSAQQSRHGQVLRLLGDLEDSGRMARILVAVEDPFALQLPHKTQPPLLMGSFVKVQIEGQVLDDVIAIPAALLRENDTVWLFADDRLNVRAVDVAYRDQEKVLIRSGIAPGDQLVASALSTATEGMPLRVKAGQSEPSI